jgi:inorganic pyrophosphatase
VFDEASQFLPNDVREEMVHTSSRLASLMPRPLPDVGTVSKIFLPKHVGKPGTSEFRVFFERAGKRISPWTNIPLFDKAANRDLAREEVINMVVEIPRGTDIKYEISKEEEHNPIKQDVKDGKLRVLKHGKIPFHYGAIPKTWESPHDRVKGLTVGGDNDPLDVVDVGAGDFKVGDVVKVRVIGALCLIDQGESDWKIIAINTADPSYEKVHDSRDLAFHFPTAEQTIREWFRSYKVADGKGVNTFAFGERVLPKAEALDVIEECGVAWGKDYKSTHRTLLSKEFELPQRQDVEAPVHAPPKPRHH